MFTLVYRRTNNVPYVAAYEYPVYSQTVGEAVCEVKRFLGLMEDSYVGTLWGDDRQRMATISVENGVVNVERLDAASVLLDNMEGCTVKRSTGEKIEPKRGYWVGGRLTLQFATTQPRERIEPILSAWIDALPDNARNVGIWTSGEKIYVDAVDLISNRENALRVGKERGELAIWDIRNSCEVSCKDA